MNIGNSIKLCRQQKKWSQTELAKKAEISVSFLSLLERNKRDPNLSTLQGISKALGIPLSVLMFLSAEGDELSCLGSEVAEKLSWVTFKLIQESKNNDNKVQA
jgi:transcriptional regulator with XRE-family HTH domain